MRRTTVKTGLDRLPGYISELPLGKTPGVLCHQASVTGELTFIIDFLMEMNIEPRAIFGPQHGLFGIDQANMVEWEGDFYSRVGIPVYSLYGKNREPTIETLSGLSSLLVDLQDAGARYYTYIWTALLTLRACYKAGIPVIILDRPNPIGGKIIEGPGIETGYESFVGLSSIPIRHGCSICELLSLLAGREGLESALYTVPMDGWNRDMLWTDTGLQWVNPSPNMPSPTAAFVYPGGCLVEGTNLSEGRGTTRPFELVGAPWVDAQDFAEELSRENLNGVAFRPCSFKPTFDKYAGETCNGVQVHITEKTEFKPVITYYTIIKTARALYPTNFRWAEPPYEYEFEKLPIDILAGGSAFREALESNTPASELEKSWHNNESRFRAEREPYLIYGYGRYHSVCG